MNRHLCALALLSICTLLAACGPQAPDSTNAEPITGEAASNASPAEEAKPSQQDPLPAVCIKMRACVVSLTAALTPEKRTAAVAAFDKSVGAVFKANGETGAKSMCQMGLRGYGSLDVTPEACK